MSIQPIDTSKMARLEERLLSKAMPPYSLGRFSDLALHLALISPKPIDRFCLLLFAGDHGVIEHNVTHSKQEITWQQCVNFAQGGGVCSLFAKSNDAALKVIDVGVNHLFSSDDLVCDAKVGMGTRDMLSFPAMTGEECLKAMEVGKRYVREQVSKGFDAIGFGEMGVGNTTSASAIAAAITGVDVPLLTGRGSGLSDEEVLHKVSVVQQALVKHPDRNPLSILANLGGFEIAAISGGIVQASELGLPILLDGFVVTAAALVACALEPNCTAYLIACHQSATMGHRLLLDYLHLPSPLLDLGMQLGEGTGALLAWPIVKLASRFLSEMNSFSDANVTNSTQLLQQLGLV